MSLNNTIRVSPSLLAADLLDLENEIKKLDTAGADMLHIDVMDGHFVPNLGFSQYVVQRIKEITKIPLDVHLMVQQPNKLLESFASLLTPLDIIIVHYESSFNILSTILNIKKRGLLAGIALSPSTPEAVLQYLYPYIDMVLVMTVNPGFTGQEFLSEQLGKVKAIRNASPKLDIAVDGGINAETGKLAVAQGANILISGKYIFSDDYKQKIESLKF